jgi:hypothetical protein
MGIRCGASLRSVELRVVVHHEAVSSKRRQTSRSADPIRPDYLRTLGENIDEALALIVHDVVATGALTPAEAGAMVRNRAADYLKDQVANGFNPRADDTAVWVAEAVQEDLIEGLGIAGRLVTWPPCPEHPNHPLWLRSAGKLDRDADDPVWRCSTTNQPVAELGRLEG